MLTERFPNSPDNQLKHKRSSHRETSAEPEIQNHITVLEMPSLGVKSIFCLLAPELMLCVLNWEITKSGYVSRNPVGIN